MTPSQVNPSPKTRFQESDNNISKHHTLIESGEYQRAEDFALMHYARVLAADTANSADPKSGKNPQVEGMVNAWKLAGAQEFVNELRNLAEKPITLEAPGKARTLNQQAN